ncbi:HAD-IIIA family hydrolase [Anaerorhabdus furcosa]|uniref:D,D-heptose 1,7-bisphosphate phosphatase n=1 Tax=Anaerorhabdus furcosa TaxID=118967 RepID=A0A1T4PXL2_9FIRM|nr:HAD-IIIA family hydrolase [Anaerorhabdus furcosa]SJZ95698.1 D-glycero-D-manno-heptose 1,7-bisphosphate phosphatase [Anaerorhabdus furcosa]
MKIAFLDRDGTINLDYPNQMWAKVKEPEFLEGSFEGLKFILSQGYQIIIITNQYIIQDGIITEKQYHEFHNLFLNRLKKEGITILDTFYCPHNDSEACSCKKPKDGLIRQALQKYPSIDLSNSFYVGDSLCDKQLANTMKLPFYTNNLALKEDSFYIKNLNDLRNYIKKK